MGAFSVEENGGNTIGPVKDVAGPQGGSLTEPIVFLGGKQVESKRQSVKRIRARPKKEGPPFCTFEFKSRVKDEAQKPF